jgi:hypothetical protein
MPVVVIAPRDGVNDRVRGHIDEVKVRGGCIIGIIPEGGHELHAVLDHVITIPRTRDALTPILASVPLQIPAHHIAVLRVESVDQRRNLAKSVTAEYGRDGRRAGQGERNSSVVWSVPPASAWVQRAAGCGRCGDAGRHRRWSRWLAAEKIRSETPWSFHNAFATRRCRSPAVDRYCVPM